MILAPTRELGIQIYNEYKRLVEGRNINVAVLSKANTSGKEIQNADRLDTIITTPLRLLYLIKEKKIDFAQYINDFLIVYNI